MILAWASPFNVESSTFAQILLWGAILAPSKEKQTCMNQNKVTPPCLPDHIDFTDKILKKVVVANHCFTSLFGTNGLLSDIVIR